MKIEITKIDLYKLLKKEFNIFDIRLVIIKYIWIQFWEIFPIFRAEI